MLWLEEAFQAQAAVLGSFSSAGLSFSVVLQTLLSGKAFSPIHVLVPSHKDYWAIYLQPISWFAQYWRFLRG